MSLDLIATRLPVFALVVVVAASCGCATPAGEPPDRGREPEPVVGTDGAGESPISYGAPA
ncbi:MAG: hypothetical protein IT379_07255, partial [Deltaproteobacteria bacterium]|nr:hypothetical protein [Deltaproteobacteria bacterium]